MSMRGLRVFVSYSSGERASVKSLAEDLSAAGIDVWLDQDLAGGSAWWNRILSEIRDCDVFLFALTRASLASNACELERRYAADLKKRILPILLTDEVSSNLLPSDLTALQYVDYRRADKGAALKLLGAFLSLPVAEPLPEPLPTPPEIPRSYLGRLRDKVTQSGHLTFEEQAALVLKLKDGVDEEPYAKDAIELLSLLRKRDDLFAKVAVDIDAILRRDAVRPVASEPSPDSREDPAKNTMFYARQTNGELVLGPLPAAELRAKLRRGDLGSDWEATEAVVGKVEVQKIEDDNWAPIVAVLRIPTAQHWAKRTGSTRRQIISAIESGQLRGFQLDGEWYVDQRLQGDHR